MMGVDFYKCDVCGECIYEECVSSCAKCKQGICDDCAVGFNGEFITCRELAQIDKEEEPEEYEEALKEIKGYGLTENFMEECYISPKYCPFCNGKEIGDVQIIDYCLKKLGKTKEEIINEIKTKDL